jgi:hypothetical protein
MQVKGKFILLELSEFANWLNLQNITRKIKLIQQHHTYIPAYKHFKGDNHFKLCESMERSHLERGFAEIGQNFTTFPDGKIMVCRSLNKIPAGIKGANSYGICIENVGNFNAGADTMNKSQRDTIIAMTKTLLSKFSLVPNDQSVVYHHWYDLTLGKRITREGSGTTKTCPVTDYLDYLFNFKTKCRLHLKPSGL